MILKDYSFLWCYGIYLSQIKYCTNIIRGWEFKDIYEVWEEEVYQILHAKVQQPNFLE